MNTQGLGPAERRTRGLARYRPPRAQEGHCRRPRVTALLDAVSSQERVVVVTAPSGYGKTCAVSEWAASLDEPVAWLSLGPFDTDEDLIASGVLRALSSVTARSATRSERAPRRPGESAPLARRFEQLQDEVTEPVTLVIDDAHRAGDELRTGLLGALVEGGPEQLRLVIIGTSVVEIELSRLVLTRPGCVIGSHQLAFDLDEAAALAGPEPALPPESLLDLTHGWPIAVRLLCLVDSPTGLPEHAPGPAILRDYLRDHVLATLRPELQDFALDTAIGIDLTPGLAAAISGVDHAENLLEECARLGLFLDRVDTRDGVVYRWHALFVQLCRAILEASDVARLRRGHRRAAEFLDADDPLNAIAQRLKAGDHEAAMDVLLRHWRWLLVGADPHALHQACLALPASYHDDPRILLMRASVQEVLDARENSAALVARATQAAGKDSSSDASDGVEELFQVVHMLVGDDRDQLVRHTRAVYDSLSTATQLDPRERLATLCLIGWTGLRLRTDPTFFSQVLTMAADEAEALGEVEVARRVLGHLALFLAWASWLTRTRAVLERLETIDPRADRPLWQAYAGGSAELAEGMVAFWANDLETAVDAFRRAIDEGGLEDSVAGVARCLLAIAASATGDPRLRALAGREAQAIPLEDARGLPWRAYRTTALAALFEASGQRDRAARIAERFRPDPTAPLMTILLADIVRRSGDAHGALKSVLTLKPYGRLPFVRVPLLLDSAVVRRRDGDPQEAHRLCELALECAAAETIRYPLCNGGLEMRQLLTEHLAWGTRFEEFVVGCLTPREKHGPLQKLSEREGAVFAQLRTTRTIQEIADALGVSINTVKTHQRAVYRKLGVSSRREAVRRFG